MREKEEAVIEMFRDYLKKDITKKYLLIEFDKLFKQYKENKTLTNFNILNSSKR
jgi:hypothetical protein